MHSNSFMICIFTACIVIQAFPFLSDENVNLLVSLLIRKDDPSHLSLHNGQWIDATKLVPLGWFYRLKFA